MMAFNTGRAVRLRFREDDVRDMLLQLGVGHNNATMLIPYMFFLPRTCDPDAQGVMFVVAALQNGLNRRGANLQTDGYLGKKTAAAIRRVSGPTWVDKTWVQIAGDILKSPKGDRQMSYMGNYYSGMGDTDYASGGLAWVDSSQHPGVCLAKDKTSLSVAWNVQKQTNRLAQYYGFSKIAQDGQIGPRTVRAVNLALKNARSKPIHAAFVSFAAGNLADCNQVFKAGNLIVSAFRQLADSFGVPASVTVPKPKLVAGTPAVSTVDPSTGKVQHTVATPAFAGFSSTQKLLMLGALGIVALLYLKSKKKKPAKKKAKKRRRLPRKRVTTTVYGRR
jgi:lysozyme family protein